MIRKKGLGKGLEALFEDNSITVSAPQQIKISEIQPNRNQPRQEFDPATLAQLADSIQEHGILQPLILRPIASGGYQIVAGERRYRAAQMAGISELPAMVRELSDIQTMQIALIENLQREDLNPIEEAWGYHELIHTHDFTQDEVAKSVGKSRPGIANALRLLNLPDQVLQLVRQGSISPGHARALLSLETDQQMIDTAQVVIKQEMTVRALENIVKKMISAHDTNDAGQAAEQFQPSPKQRYYKEMQWALTSSLGRKVEIKPGNKKSKLVIEFYDKTDLQDLINKTFGELEMQHETEIIS